MTATTRLYTHTACAKHDTGPHHVEQVARLGAVIRRLSDDEFHGLEVVEAPRADAATIALAHADPYVERLMATIPETGFRHLDPDTVVCPESGEAALRAAGALCAAIDDVVSGQVRNGFCAVRPPGHHAEGDQAMGFCLINNVAVGAHHARSRHGMTRVAVLDFDVHHGNGTQAIFWGDPDLFYGSTHQYPLFPGTGRVSERGCGNIFNVPLAPGSGSAQFRAAMDEAILPALEAFRPDAILLSAGFDAHRDDPLGGLDLDESDFEWITLRALEIADRCCAGRVVSALEGGYNLSALAESAAAHVRALMQG